MNFTIGINFAPKLSKRIKDLEHSIESLQNNMKLDYQRELQKIVFSAQKGIICDTCGTNVYSNTGTWVHSEGKAYCLKPCWSDKLNGDRES